MNNSKKRKKAVKKIAKNTVFGTSSAQEMMNFCKKHKYNRDSKVAVKMAKNGMSIDLIFRVLKAVNK